MLLLGLKGSADPSTHLDQIRQTIASGTLNSEQGKEVLDLLSPFDKVRCFGLLVRFALQEALYRGTTLQAMS